MRKKSLLVWMLMLQAMVLIGCGKKEETPGEKLDAALRKAGESMQEAGREIEEAGSENR